VVDDYADALAYSMASNMTSGYKWRFAAFGLLVGAVVGATAARQGVRKTAAPRVGVRSPGTGPAITDHGFSSPAALEQLSGAVMRKRVIEIFPVVYLTLMAIIQGAAFGILFLTVAQHFPKPAWSLHAATVYTEAFATCLAILIVTHEYLLLTVVVRWVPTVFDTLIPFLLGSAEIWIALVAGDATWWWVALSALCVVGILAFWHTKARATEEEFGSARDLYVHNRREITRQIYICTAMLSASLIVVLLNCLHDFPALVDIGLIWIFVVAGIVVLVLGERNQHVFYDKYRIPRWRILGQDD
jgi:hypothetical protein